MSKAARIRELYAKGVGCTEIARIIGCRPEYARVCAQQRVHKGKSNSDKRYLSDPDVAERRRKWRREYSKWRYHTDPSFRRRHLAAKRRYAARMREEARA